MTTTNKKYFGSFGDLQDVIREFGPIDRDDPVPTEEELLFASYGGGGYDGDAVVIFEQCGTLYEVHGSHCSCNGLEEQWNPDEVTWESLNLRIENMKSKDNFASFLYEHEEGARQTFIALVESRATPAGILAAYHASER